MINGSSRVLGLKQLCLRGVRKDTSELRAILEGCPLYPTRVPPQSQVPARLTLGTLFPTPCVFRVRKGFPPKKRGLKVAMGGTGGASFPF